MSGALRDDCLRALAETTARVSSTWLGGLTVRGGARDATPGAHGALVSLQAGERALQAGLFVAPEAAQALTKFFVGLAPTDEDLDIDDVADAMCELANVLVGGVKSELSAVLAVTLGLPHFYSTGYPKHPGIVGSSLPLRIGGFPVMLVVIG